MIKEMVTVRDVDQEVLKKFKAKTVEKEMKMGVALTQALRNWVEQKEEKPEPDQENLVKLEGIFKAEKQVRWSEEVDEFLYELHK